MLAVLHRSISASPTTPYGVSMADSGTINPAALNAPASTVTPHSLPTASPRGTKRSRSPDRYAATGQEGGGGDAKTNKVRKLRAGERAGESAARPPNMPLAAAAMPVHTPQMKTSALPHGSPTQASPARSTPGSATKPPVVKALPTVRDHTTDQLGPEGDEYVPREIDVDGETKVSKNGCPLDGRRYRCRTFQVPDRGEKLFMLATDCARVLGYRDSYLLFNKNRSLFKIIANQREKDNLIQQEILPYSYRSRQIAIVTARSMFRQFGARLIEGGRRVRDDYWEAKARKQGFTEEDHAGEKRPGAAKAREQAAAEALAHNQALASMPRGEIIYSNAPGIDGEPPGLGQVSLAPLPMIHLPTERLSSGVAGANVIRPRQEVTGPPYIDRIQSSTTAEIMSQAASAADYNKQLAAQRDHRFGYLDNYWKRPHEQPTTRSLTEPPTSSTVVPQSLQSPRATAGLGQHRQPESMHPSSSQMLSQNYPSYQNQQNAMASPVQAMRQQNSMQGSPMGMSGHRQTPSYGGYNPSQMWPPPQAQPSPLSQSHVSGGYGPPQHHSPMPPPQMPPQGMYPPMNQMNVAAYGMNRSMYQPNPSQFNMGPQSGAGPQPGMQGWANPGMPQNYGAYQ